MPKIIPKAESVDLTSAELYQMHRTIVALTELECLLRKRWGARSTTVLHLDAISSDLDEVFSSESNDCERAIMNKYFEAEQLGWNAVQAAAIAEMEALTKPG